MEWPYGTLFGTKLLQLMTVCIQCHVYGIMSHRNLLPKDILETRLVTDPGPIRTAHNKSPQQLFTAGTLHTGLATDDGLIPLDEVVPKITIYLSGEVFTQLQQAVNSLVASEDFVMIMNSSSEVNIRSGACHNTSHADSKYNLHHCERARYILFTCTHSLIIALHVHSINILDQD